MADLEVIRGRVEATNDKGIKVNGEWKNYSKYAKPEDVDGCAKGDNVELGTDNAGFIRKLTRLEGGGSVDNVRSGYHESERREPDSWDRPGPDEAPEERAAADMQESSRNSISTKDTLIIRQTCIKAAAHFAAMREDIKSKDVVAIAEIWEKWITR